MATIFSMLDGLASSPNEIASSEKSVVAKIYFVTKHGILFEGAKWWLEPSFSL